MGEGGKFRVLVAKWIQFWGFFWEILSAAEPLNLAFGVVHKGRLSVGGGQKVCSLYGRREYKGTNFARPILSSLTKEQKK
jgi:hypothetical protein